jgi:hypothetical protein
MSRSASSKLQAVQTVNILKIGTTGLTLKRKDNQSNRSKKEFAVLFRAIKRLIFKQHRLNRLKVLYLKLFDNYIILQMTSNGRISSQERIETASGATRHQIDESRY